MSVADVEISEAIDDLIFLSARFNNNTIVSMESLWISPLENYKNDIEPSAASNNLATTTCLFSKLSESRSSVP